MAHSSEEWAKRVDRAAALHESALEQVMDVYTLCKKIETQEKRLVSLCESLSKETRPEILAKKATAESHLADLRNHKADVEAQFQKCVRYAEEIGGFKILVNQLANAVFEKVN